MKPKARALAAPILVHLFLTIAIYLAGLSASYCIDEWAGECRSLHCLKRVWI